MEQRHSGKGDNVAGNKIVNVRAKYLFFIGLLLLLILVSYFLYEVNSRVPKSKVAITKAYVNSSDSSLKEPRQKIDSIIESDLLASNFPSGKRMKGDTLQTSVLNQESIDSPQAITYNSKKLKASSHELLNLRRHAVAELLKSKASKFEFDIAVENNDVGYFGKSTFPEITFVLQNKGNIDAYLHEFEVEVVDLKLDRSPVLEITSMCCTDDDSPMVVCTLYNHGYGRAMNLQFHTDDQILAMLEPYLNIMKQTTIEGDSEIEVFRLPLSEFDSLIGQKHGYQLDLEILYDDVYKKSHRFSKKMTIDKWDCCHCPASALHSEVMYVTLFDFPRNNPAELTSKTYLINRDVPIKGLDLFKIKVGANKSCSFSSIFKFKVDDYLVVSDTFHLKVWNPSNSYVQYFDGQEIVFEK